jgi:hypothetical protein
MKKLVNVSFCQPASPFGETLGRPSIRARPRTDNGPFHLWDPRLPSALCEGPPRYYRAQGGTRAAGQGRGFPVFIRSCRSLLPRGFGALRILTALRPHRPGRLRRLPPGGRGPRVLRPAPGASRSSGSSGAAGTARAADRGAHRLDERPHLLSHSSLPSLVGLPWVILLPEA